MPTKVWSAAELDQMSAGEVDDLFRRSLVTDLDEMPSRLIETVRHDIERRAGKNDSSSRQ